MFSPLSLLATVAVAINLAKTVASQSLPGGLVLRTKFEDFHLAAEQNGWAFEPAPVSSNSWSEADSGNTFRFCNQTLFSVDQEIECGLREFADIVFKFKVKHGEPNTNVFVLSPKSRFEGAMSESGVRAI